MDSSNTGSSSTKGTSNGQGSQSSRQGSSPDGAQSLPSTSAVDLAGRRLREQQLQDRFEAAQSFIERTVGQPLPSSDLHESLKDGVILCRLANRLRPGTVEQISLKNLPFVKMENISNFLNAAKQLGVQSSDLFQTVDLYEGKDMTQVISTILTLERILGGVARMVAKDKRPGPSLVPSQTSKAGVLRPPTVTRMRSKTAHTPSSVASTTPSIRPSSSAYYAAQVRKLEEENMHFAHGYDRLEASTSLSKDQRHQSTPMITRVVTPSGNEKVSHRPSLSDIPGDMKEDKGFGNGDIASSELDAENRREQRALVFGRDSPSSTLKQLTSTTISKSSSGSMLLSERSRMSSLDMTRRKKKSISLDPQAANAVMGNQGYRDGLGSPGSPGLLTQSMSYNAISNLHSPGLSGATSQMSFKQHSRFSSEKTSPTSSRSTTPVQGLRKNANSVEPLREKLELYENDTLSATFQLGNCIGRGQFGSVYKALNLVTGQMMAVKRIKIDGLKENEMDMLMQEVDLLKSLAHPSIVKYEGFIKTYGFLNIILEFVENGSLLTTLKSFGAFPEKLVVAYVVKILEGLVYLHGKQVVHCDLKAANILTTKNGNVKLSDFGVSLNLKVKESDFGAVAGTPNWMAPEVIELKGASPASDIWSLGCTIIEMLTGRPPYADLLAMTTLFRIVEDERPPLPSNLSMDLLDFLCQCFQKDPTLRPSAGALGRHVWIKRNFASKELKPMDSLPYMKRKSLEPKEKLIIAAALDGVPGNSAKRASTPLGLSSGAPPPSPSATAMEVEGRGTRRRSVDSASGFYSSSTVPAPTSPLERNAIVGKGRKTSNHHRFVKSSFAKPVECRLCHEHVKKQAVICQDCSMVFHRKCQFFVGDTCFPAPHLSFFQVPTPAQSVPNLKLMANGKPKGSSRPSSRTSVVNMEDHRSRSATPSQCSSSRPCPTPPPPALTSLSKRESIITTKERAEQRMMMSSPAPSSLLAQRSRSPETTTLDIECNIQPPSPGRVPRPPSRQSDSPTSPTTLSNLRNLISGPRRFSFGTKKNSNNNAPVAHPLPTPPTSYTSAAPALSSSSQYARLQTGTPELVKPQYQQQRAQPPVTPPKTLPVPIVSSKGGPGGGRPYRGRQHGGPMDAYENDDNHDGRFNYGRGSQRPSSITMFSTSAPPVHGEYHHRMGRVSVASTASCPEDDEEVETHRDDETEVGNRYHQEVREMDEQDLEALLIPSIPNRSPRLSLEIGGGAGGHYRTKSQSISQTLSQSMQQQQHQPLKDASSHALDSSRPSSSSISFGLIGRPSNQQQQQQYGHASRAQVISGYQSSGSSSAAMTSSYSSHSNNSSSASSLGSVAALLEEEERMLKEMKQNQGRNGASPLPLGKKNGQLGVPIPSGYLHQGTQPPQAHHVGIKTMLSRFSSSSNKDITKDIANTFNNNGVDGQSTLEEKGKEHLQQQQQQQQQQRSKSTAAYAAASRYQIQAPPPVHHSHSAPQQQESNKSTSKVAKFAQGYEHHNRHHHQHRYEYSPRRGITTAYVDGLPSNPVSSGSGSSWRPPTSSPPKALNGSQQHQLDDNDVVFEEKCMTATKITNPLSSASSSSASTPGPAMASSIPVSAASAAASAIRRGGKVIRRSMGATMERDRWD
ncbi:hypothetical protein BGX28_004475 [Mortierella sp. GBA30]|nr:hypothetical protein BGX28_004475 [Mortierella sp. GBA30]